MTQSLDKDCFFVPTVAIMDQDFNTVIYQHFFVTIIGAWYWNMEPLVFRLHAISFSFGVGRPRREHLPSICMMSNTSRLSGKAKVAMTAQLAMVQYRRSSDADSLFRTGCLAPSIRRWRVCSGRLCRIDSFLKVFKARQSHLVKTANIILCRSLRTWSIESNS